MPVTGPAHERAPCCLGMLGSNASNKGDNAMAAERAEPKPWEDRKSVV